MNIFPDNNYKKILTNYFVYEQAKPSDLLLHNPSRKLHIRSLCSGLFYVRQHIEYVLQGLERWNDEEWCLYENRIAHELTVGTIILAGLLDGLIVCALSSSSVQSNRKTSFYNTNFHRPDLESLQSKIKNYKSSASANCERYADFWTIANYWKHYLPFQPRPSYFSIERVRDFKINIDEGQETGPVLFDLIVPTFNDACKIAVEIAREEMLDDQYVVGILSKLTQQRCE